MKSLRNTFIFMMSSFCIGHGLQAATFPPTTPSGACVNNLTRKPAKISVILPVYRELKNGNIFRILKAFANQSISYQNYELVIVVNNSPNIARPGNPIFEENQQTLQALKYVNGTLQTLPEKFVSTLSAEQRKILWVARNKKLNIHTIDLSSSIPPQGITYPGRNMAAFRNIGIQNVFQRFPEEDRILMLFDADTWIDRLFLEKAGNYFLNPEIEAVFASVDYKVQPQGTQSLFKSTFAYRYLIGQFDLENLVFNPKRNIQVSGYQILLRSSALRKRGGNIPLLPLNKDDAAVGDLFSTSQYLLPADLETVTLDRVRADGLIDSVYRSEYSMHNQSVPQDIDLISKTGPLHIDALRNNLRFNEIYNLEDQLSEAPKNHARLVRDLIRGLHHVYKNEKLPFFKHEFFDENNWIVKTVVNLKNNGRSFQELMKYFKTEFPDWFLPFEQTPSKKRADELRILTLFLRNALTHPDQFPSTVQYLKTLSNY